jgi:hypothetical protein
MLEYLTDRFFRLKQALEQARAALPDASFAGQEGIDPDLIIRINCVLHNSDDYEVLKRALIDAREALPIAWINHGGVSQELLDLIDSAILM